MIPAPVLVLSGPGPFPEEEWNLPPWPDRESLRSPGDLVLAAGDAPGELWYTDAKTNRRIQRALPGRDPAPADGGRSVEFFLDRGIPSPEQLDEVRRSGCDIASLWVPFPVRPSEGPGAGLELVSECLGLLRDAGFGTLRLLPLLSEKTREKDCRRLIDLLLADRRPMEIRTFSLREESGDAGKEKDGFREFVRFYAPLFVLTRSEEMRDDSIWVVLTDPFLRSHPDVLGDVAYHAIVPSERILAMRRKVEALAAHLPVAEVVEPEVAEGEPSLPGKLKARARENLPAPVWHALRRFRRALAPTKEV
jgi:hypothetical protein